METRKLPLLASICVSIALPHAIAAQGAKLPGRVVDVPVAEYFIVAPDSVPAGLVTLRVTQTGDARKPWPGNLEEAPRWVRWGLVGAVVGAVTMPLLSGLASDNEQNLGRDVVGGAIAGFVIVGGSVALWDAVCGGNTRSRRAGLCGRR